MTTKTIVSAHLASVKPVQQAKRVRQRALDISLYSLQLLL
jgi:hypothetical protein